MANSPKFVWVLLSGNDDEPGTAENFQDVYSTKSKAKKGAQEIMNGYKSENSWWDKTDKKDEIIWYWFYKREEETRDTGNYVRIDKCEIK